MRSMLLARNFSVIPRSRLYGPAKPRRFRRDPPVKRPPEADSARLDEWDSAVDVLKRGRGQPQSLALTGGLRIALLIDAENITYKNVDGIIHEVEKLGLVQIKRIYADWTSEIMRGWRQTVLTNALTPIHQFQSSSGKGNTDSMMIIDAMDILHKNRDIESFCIVSSDADFTRLATKLREEGKLVLGIGSNLTPAPFVVACNRFVYLHNLVKEESQSQGQQPLQVLRTLSPSAVNPQQLLKVPLIKQFPNQPLPTQPGPISSATQQQPLKVKARIDFTQMREAKPPLKPGDVRPTVDSDAIKSALPLFTRAWASFRMDDGWAPLIGFSSELQRIQPEFSIGEFGPFSKLEELLEATDAFEIRRSKTTAAATLVRRVMMRPSSSSNSSSNSVNMLESM